MMAAMTRRLCCTPIQGVPEEEPEQQRDEKKFCPVEREDCGYRGDDGTASVTSCVPSATPINRGSRSIGRRRSLAGQDYASRRAVDRAVDRGVGTRARASPLRLVLRVIDG